MLALMHLPARMIHAINPHVFVQENHRDEASRASEEYPEPAHYATESNGEV
jgi:hypothetical protein